MDEQEHVRLRRAILRNFSAPRRASLQAQAELTMQTLLRDVARRRQGDYITEVAEPFALRVLCDLLALPHSDSDRMASWVHVLLSEATNEADKTTHTAALSDMGQYVYSIIAERAAHPQDDFISALIKSEGLSKKECAIVVIGLIFGGFESSATMLSKMVLKLLSQPSLRHTLCGDVGLVPRAVEELLRTISIAGGEAIPWRVQEPVTLGGVDMEPGDFVMPATGTANLDPTVYSAPEHIHLDRKQVPHLAFGHGLHKCLGYQIARMEMNVGLRTLLTHYPDSQLAVPVEQITWSYDSTIWQIAHLPITAVPRERPLVATTPDVGAEAG
jgi:cytochrome P450